MTRAEVAAYVDGGGDRAVLALGATEQHGTALPLGTDTIIGDLIADALALRIDAVVAPTLPVGLSSEHMGHPGTLTLTAATLVATVEEVCRGLIDGGFRRIVLLVAHFGNLAPAMAAAQEVVAGTGALVAVSSYFAGAEERLSEALGRRPGQIDWTWFHGHAGAAEAAMVMAARPDLVRMERAEPGAVARAALFFNPAMWFPAPADWISSTCTWGHPDEVVEGDPGGVDAGMGRTLVDTCAAALAERFARLSVVYDTARTEGWTP